MSNFQSYSPEDFAKNPRKYELFRSARVVDDVLSIPPLRAGQFINIRFYATQTNRFCDNVDMPIYQA